MASHPPRAHEVRAAGKRVFYVIGDAGAGYTEPHTSVIQVSGPFAARFSIPTDLVASWRLVSAPLYRGLRQARWRL